jgi:DNA-binding Xre family transcriptional regulator
MSTVQFNLDPFLRQHKTTPLALAEASGLSKTTVYNIVNNKAKAVELETLSKLMTGLRTLTGEAVAISDILKEETVPDWREDILRKAEPLDWQKMLEQLPPLTPEEQADGEAFIALLEERRNQDRELSFEKREKLLELLEDEQ